LAEWAAFALAPQGQAPARHHRAMIRELEAVAAGSCDRLMLLLPPGSAKSTYASLLFPAWFLARQPGAHVIAASHTAGLATAFGRGVRGLLREHRARLGVGVDPLSRAAHRFGVTGGGTYYATGVRGPVTGRRADLAVIDDPVKGYAEADSRAQRDALWDWYRSDLLTRLKPGGRVVLVMTRWHPDDLGGRLLAGTEDWRVVRLPALAEAGDPLGRAPGEALWPEWENAAALERKRLAMGDRAWAALFQQSPRTAGGRLFQVGRVAVTEAVLPGMAVRAWDLAASVTGDWTAGVRLARSAEGTFQVQDVARLKGGPEQVVQAIQAAAERDGPGVAIGLPQDPGQAGRSQVAFLTARLAGWRVVSSPESGAKAVRAMPVASQVNAGTVSVLAGAWNGAFLAELEDFPGGACDDQVDALSRAFEMLVAQPAPGVARVARVDWGDR
jgi:predicted phage terminase large subunit-like protein